MDIDLLAKMVGELILENDEVALPGVGTFVAEFVGASFSDKGFVINPPYRKLSFRHREGDGSLLIDFYARTNQLDKTTASDILTRFLSEMKEILKTKKYIVFPGLGRLRATKENLFFFVPDENLNIYPEGFGLEPVSLKTHGELTEIAELAETVEAIAGLSAPVPAEPAVPAAASDIPSAEVPSSDVPVEAPSAVGLQAPADKTSTEALHGVPPREPVFPEPAASEPSAPAPAESEPAAPKPTPSEPSAPVPAISEPARKKHSHHRSRRHKLPLWERELLILLGIGLGLLLLFAILGRVAPEWVDHILYSPEELEILYK